jgi:hypothetical protein
VLAVVVLGSLLVVPLSEQYARESTPADLWHQPAFRYRRPRYRGTRCIAEAQRQRAP